ncbi:MAG: hypothetical protein QOG87_751, partial [Actinomycetota bacterium]
MTIATRPRLVAASIALALVGAACSAAKVDARLTMERSRPSHGVIDDISHSSADSPTEVQAADGGLIGLILGPKQPPPPPPPPPPPSGGGGVTSGAARFTRLNVVADTSSSWMTFDLGTRLVRSRVAINGAGAEIAWRPNGFSITPKRGMFGQPQAGSSRVVLDLVYALGSEPSDALSLCGGNSGSVAVHVERRTSSTETLVDMHHPAVGPQCVSTSVSRATLAGPVAWPQPIDPTRRVMAFYYPWYTPESFDSGNWVDKPVAPYDTEDPAAVRQSVDLAASSGIDGFMVSYSHDEPNDGRRLDRVFDAADARSGFTVCTNLEVEHMRGSGFLGAVTAP